MNKVKTIVPIALACIAIIVFFLSGTVISYLTDAETKTNIITIGNVALEISEPSYEDSSIVAAGDSLAKNPVITNTGTKDEYVFFRVGVPKRNVTLLYENATTVNNKTYNEGTPTVNNRILDNNGETTAINKNVDEIYRIIAEGVNGAIPTAVSDELGENPPEPNTYPQLDFSYNAGDSTTENDKKEGWIYLKRELNQPTSGTDAGKYDYYYFGYNTRLAKDTPTIPLFDRIQLKSFIDEEVNSRVVSTVTVNGQETQVSVPVNEKTQIKIDAYGIQADSLGENLNSLGEFVGKEDLTEIFNIIKTKKG